MENDHVGNLQNLSRDAGATFLQLCDYCYQRYIEIFKYNDKQAKEKGKKKNIYHLFETTDMKKPIDIVTKKLREKNKKKKSFITQINCLMLYR